MSAPYQAVKASDNYFVMGATNNKLFTALCKLMDRNDLLNSEKYKDIPDRLRNREALIEELERSFSKKTAAEWVSILLEAGLPAGPILNYAEAFESDHARHRKMRIDIDHPVEGTVPNIGFPVKFQGTPQRVRMPPPLLGEHTNAILLELGVTELERVQLAKAGAFAV